MRKCFSLFAAAAFAVSAASCGGYGYFAAGTEGQRLETRKLFELLAAEKNGSEARFILIQRIASNLMAAGENEKLNLFLTSYCEENPGDPFGGYYLFIVAQNYREARAYPLAAHYYERVLRSYPDIQIRGEGIHLLCLKELVRILERPEQRVVYYRELLKRFGGQIDVGSVYFSLAKACETLGEWSEALWAYGEFLKYPEAQVSGYADARAQVVKIISFHNSDKSWTRRNLDALILSIKNAIDAQDIRSLNRLRAGVNFFAMSWDQEESSVNTQVMFDLGSFLRGSRVNYSDRLDADSSANEAYLETWGWSYRLPTWYLYFRKISYPGDPEINGRWEWAGIYFGEKF
jgi:tetratricopeptide (TPR) repeat protein